MESEEAIMENENNCNVESESINRERSAEEFQETWPDHDIDQSVSETTQLGSSAVLENLDKGSVGCHASAPVSNSERFDNMCGDAGNRYPKAGSVVKETNTATQLLKSDNTDYSLNATYAREFQENITVTDTDMGKGNFNEEGKASAINDEPMDLLEQVKEAVSTTITFENNEGVENVFIKDKKCDVTADSATYENQEKEMSTENVQVEDLKSKNVFFETENATLSPAPQETDDGDKDENGRNQNIGTPVASTDEANDDEVDLIEDPADSEVTATKNLIEYFKSPATGETKISNSDLQSIKNDGYSPPSCGVNEEQESVGSSIPFSNKGVDQESKSQNVDTESDSIKQPNHETLSNQLEESQSARQRKGILDYGRVENQSGYGKEVMEEDTSQSNIENMDIATKTASIEPPRVYLEQNTLTEAAVISTENEKSMGHMETGDGDMSQLSKSDVQHQWINEKENIVDATQKQSNRAEADKLEASREITNEHMEMQEIAPIAKTLSNTCNVNIKMSTEESYMENEGISLEAICKTRGDKQIAVTKDEASDADQQTIRDEIVCDKVIEEQNVKDTALVNQDDMHLEKSDNGLEITSKANLDKISEISEVVTMPQAVNTVVAENVVTDTLSGGTYAHSNTSSVRETAETMIKVISETVMDLEEGTHENDKCNNEGTVETKKRFEEISYETKENTQESVDKIANDTKSTVETAMSYEEDLNETEKSYEENTNEVTTENEDTDETAKINKEDSNEIPKNNEEGINKTTKSIEKGLNETTKVSGDGTNETAKRNEDSTNSSVKYIEEDTNETAIKEIGTSELAKAHEIGSNVNANFNEEEASESAEVNKNLLDAKHIKQELMSDEESSTNASSDAKILQMIKKEVDGSNNNDVSLDQEDIVILDDDGESFPVKTEPGVMTDANLTSSVTDQENNIHEQADAQVNFKTEDQSMKGGGETKKSKSKTQACIVCAKICRCKYNIVRNGDVKHLCGDDCFKKFRKTPSAFLKNKDGKQAESPSKTTPVVQNKPKALQEALSKYKTCTVCQLMHVNPNQPFCNWKGMDFCGETCLGKFQANLNTTCSFCGIFISAEMRSSYCLKIGNDVRIFCQQRCVTEFRKNLRLCACCQKDLSSFPGAFSAMVGSLDKKIRQFCSQACRQKLETQLVGVEVVSKTDVKADNNSTSQQSVSYGIEKAQCAVCQKLQTVQHTVRFQGKVYHLCSNLCLSAFKYTNKIGLSKCDTCGTVCTVEEAQAHYVQFEGHVKRFCSDVCVNVFRKDNNKVMACCWCGTKKLNFDMIERLGADSKFQMFCSLNCLSLYRVNLQAKSNQAVACDQCKMVTPAQYHLTMSDASVRNFCSYTCVMTFQAQFTTKQLPPPSQSPVGSSPSLAKQTPPLMPLLPKETTDQQGAANRARIGTRNTIKQNSPSFPVISNVVSLAPPSASSKEPSSPATPDLSSQQVAQTLGPQNNSLSSGDGKHQILIQAPPVKVMKNKSLQCRPVALTKATSCRPHAQPKETQTEKIPDKQVMVPIPVPIYIPMPTVMYSAPTPVPVPFPIPIPVPVFIPTTRKSAAGIIKTISEIVERMPSDPLEAELLMMAEAVAADKRESDSESEAGNEYGASFDDEPEEPIPAAQGESETPQAKKKDGEGEEDMIQMALRMAEEMSGPIEDLESSVEPVAINPGPPPSIQTTPTPAYQADEDYTPPGSRGRGRGVKRSRGRPSNSRPKRQRVEKNYAEQQEQAAPQTPIPPPMIEPAADANYRLKFTYGVNAWRHWVIAKNAQIESTRKPNSGRVRTFPIDILKCTTDELNVSLIFFIKEVRKPNGEQYSPDSIYYLCLGIQQYLYENGRIDSIFTDSYFEKFADSLHEILKNLQPKVNAQGQMLCRIEEEHLWESKQLGAHSPFVLLNTLIYFHTKHFILKTAQEHMALSFAQILKHWKKGVPVKGQAATGKNISLRFYCLANSKKDNGGARKNKEGVPVYEITENFDNPLRCPVKLYEFFLSKCPESIKNRNDIFYPVPERSCVPDSPVWYSTQSIGHHTMDKMLTRVLLVREIQESHLHAQPIYL